MKNIYDIHTHILPKVDDGAASIEESLEILKDEIEQGVRGIMLTPHFRKGMFEAEESMIYAQYKILLTEARSTFPELDIRLGCELRARRDMKEDLTSRRLCTFDGGNTVLLEFSEKNSSGYIIRKTRELIALSYVPIIAHIEKYKDMYKKYDIVEELKCMGAGIQIDTDSVLGLSGNMQKRFCAGLLKRRLVDYAASDVHNMTSRRSSIANCADFIEKKYGEEYVKKIFVNNPAGFFV